MPNPRRAALAAVTALVASAGSASADLLPPGWRSVPRYTAVRGASKQSPHVPVLVPCLPNRLPDAGLVDYCVVETDAPRRISGQLWLVRRSAIELGPLATGGDEGRHEAQRITAPRPNVVDLERFLPESADVRRTDVTLGPDTVAVPGDSGLTGLTETVSISVDGDGGATVTLERRIWTCSDGSTIRAALTDAARIPDCRDEKVFAPPGPIPPRADSPGSGRPRRGPTELIVMVAAAAVLGVGAFAVRWLRRRADGG